MAGILLSRGIGLPPEPTLPIERRGRLSGILSGIGFGSSNLRNAGTSSGGGGGLDLRQSFFLKSDFAVILDLRVLSDSSSSSVVSPSGSKGTGVVGWTGVPARKDRRLWVDLANEGRLPGSGVRGLLRSGSVFFEPGASSMVSDLGTERVED